MQRKSIALSLLLTAFLLASIPSWARVNIKPGFNTFSPEQDIQLGQQAAKEIGSQIRLVSDRQLKDYIERIGRKLTGFAPGYRFPYEFNLVNDKQINAFAVPGGQVFVYTGAVLAAANEAQLAGVIAHEISHVALRHSTNQASKAMLAQAPLAILGGVLSGGIGGQLAQLGIAFGLNSVFLKFSRTAESQADELGAQIMYDAGYDPRALAQYFQTIEKESGRQSLEFLSDHPNPGNRLQNITRLIPQLGPSKSYSGNTSQFEQIRPQISRLQSSPPPRSSATNQYQQPSPASQDFRVLNGNLFQVSYPGNWQVYGQDTGTLTIVPQRGIFSGDSGSLPVIAYGAMASYFTPTTQGRRQPSLSAATNELIGELQRSNPHLHLISGSTKNFRLDGQPAYSVTALSQSPKAGTNELDWIVTTFRPEGLWFIVFIAPESDWNAYEPVFQQMLQSIRFSR